jgi:hypothetical protein
MVLVIGGAINGLLGVILSVPVASAAWLVAQRYLPDAPSPAADARAIDPAPLGERAVEPGATTRRSAA